MTTMTPEAADFTARIVDDIQDLASLPEVTARIVATIDDPDATPQDLYRIFAHDASLVSRILKVVNSSYYSRGRKIDSVERAIILLGFDAIYGIAIAASMGKLFRVGKICEQFSARDLWTHGASVAIIARHLAKLVAPALAEEAFLAGLMHDVGLLVALQAYPRKLAHVCQIAETDTRDFSTIEHAVVGVDHQQLGAELASRWRFPESTCNVIAFHHDPQLATEPSRNVTLLVYAADHLCCQRGKGFNLTALRDPLDTALLSPLISEQLLTQTADELQALIEPGLAILN